MKYGDWADSETFFYDEPLWCVAFSDIPQWSYFIRTAWAWALYDAKCVGAHRICKKSMYHSQYKIDCQLFVLRNQFSFPQNERIINRILPTVHQSHLFRLFRNFRQGDKNEGKFWHWIHSTTIFVIYSPSQRRIRASAYKNKMKRNRKWAIVWRAFKRADESGRQEVAERIDSATKLILIYLFIHSQLALLSNQIWINACALKLFAL